MKSAKQLALVGLLFCLVAGGGNVFGQRPRSSDGPPIYIVSDLNLTSPEWHLGTPLQARAPDSAREASNLMDEFEQMDRAHTKHIRRIRDLLDTLQQKIERARESPKTEAPRQPLPAERDNRHVPLVVDDAVEPVAPEQETVTPPPARLAPPNGTAAPSLQNVNTRLISNQGPRPLVTGTVDRLALANNLFVQGTVDVASSIYEELMQQPQQAADLVWIEYQLASCYRMQGRLKDAKKLYYRVASSKEENYWASRAGWWLEYLDRSQRIYERQAELKAQMETLRKEVDEFQTK